MKIKDAILSEQGTNTPYGKGSSTDVHCLLCPVALPVAKAAQREASASSSSSLACCVLLADRTSNAAALHWVRWGIHERRGWFHCV